MRPRYLRVLGGCEINSQQSQGNLLMPEEGKMLVAAKVDGDMFFNSQDSEVALRLEIKTDVEEVARKIMKRITCRQ